MRETRGEDTSLRVITRLHCATIEQTNSSFIQGAVWRFINQNTCRYLLLHTHMWCGLPAMNITRSKSARPDARLTSDLNTSKKTKYSLTNSGNILNKSGSATKCAELSFSSVRLTLSAIQLIAQIPYISTRIEIQRFIVFMGKRKTASVFQFKSERTSVAAARILCLYFPEVKQNNPSKQKAPSTGVA